MTGGYLIIDVNHKELTTGMQVDWYNKIKRAQGKYVILENISTIGSVTASTSCAIASVYVREYISLTCFITNYKIIIIVYSDNTIKIEIEDLRETQPTMLESEVSTNASKSDSNISK